MRTPYHKKVVGASKDFTVYYFDLRNLFFHFPEENKSHPSSQKIRNFIKAFLKNIISSVFLTKGHHA